MPKTYTLDVYEIDGSRREYTVQEFWDCECAHNYIHPADLNTCPICGAEQEDCPNSRLDEVVRLYPLTKETMQDLFTSLLDTLADGQFSNAGQQLMDEWLKRE